MGRTYYNEWDKHAAAWLRELIAQGHLPAGDVDERSIADVQGDDLRGYADCHFFAGIGGWPYALSLAGFCGPVWTGSCPCQPFSAAGKRLGTADARHLWPEFRRLIAECGPPIVFGEQVASKDGRGWLAGVRADLEALGYAVGAADLCAAGEGAPHIRQRLYWVADARAQRLEIGGVVGSADYAWVEHPTSTGLQGEWGVNRAGGEGYVRQLGPAMQAGWKDFIGVECQDGTRRASPEPGAFPLAHGVPARVGRLRGYGNAIVPQVAAAFVTAYMEVGYGPSALPTA